MKRSASSEAQQLAMARSKLQTLVLVSRGLAVTAAMAELGLSRSTYSYWVETDREFAQRFAEAKLAGGSSPLRGFVEFRLAYFGHGTPGHHLRMIEAIERAQPDSITMILAFPEAAKTSLMTDRINYLLGPVDPDYRICVISEGQDLSRKIVAHVANRMTDAEQFGPYISAFGPFRAPDRSLARPWNADYLQVLAAHRDEKEPSLEARGWGSKIYGGRYDELVLDDMQSSESLNQTPAMLRYLRQTALTRPAKGVGKTFYVGSRVGLGDVPETMLEEGMVSTLVTVPALTRWLDREEHFYVDRENRVHLSEGCPEISAWPDYWSMLQLAARRKMVGEEIWARTYMQRQVADAASSFTELMIETVKDRDRVLGLPPSGGLGTDRILSVDPALDTGVCAFGAYAYSSTRLWLLDVLERRDVRRYEDIYEQVGLWAMRYRPSVLVLEQNNFQKGLHQDDRMLALSAKFGFEIVSHQTSRNKNDPVIGVKMMASAFIDHGAGAEFSLPWGDEATSAKVGVLVDQLRAWRPKSKVTQDLVMQLWFAWLYWEQARQQNSLILPSQWSPSWAARDAGVPSWAAR